MKRLLNFLAAGILAVRAQENNLPQCGQTCINNMLEIALTDFNCNAGNLASCACCNAAFGYGIRDCSQATCGDGSEAYSSVISYGSAYCASAVSTCTGTSRQATSVLATATSGSSNSTMSASSSAMSGSMTSGPYAAAAAAVAQVTSASNVYVIDGDNTISPGGNTYGNDGTVYSALPSGAGVLISADGSSTTYMPGMSANATNSASGSGAAGGLAGATTGISSVSGSSNLYVVDGSSTISAGGNGADSNGTSISVLPSDAGFLIIAGGTTTTASASMTSSGASSGASGNNGGASSTGGSGGAAGGSGGSSSGQSGNKAPVKTAAPALIGAAAMAILAL